MARWITGARACGSTAALVLAVLVVVAPTGPARTGSPAPRHVSAPGHAQTAQLTERVQHEDAPADVAGHLHLGASTPPDTSGDVDALGIVAVSDPAPRGHDHASAPALGRGPPASAA